MSVLAGVVGAIVMVLIVLFMLRNGQLREKYTILWLMIGLAAIVLGCFPPLLYWVAERLHVVVPSNLLFALAIVLLAGVGLHVSHELTVLEEESRTLAEEVAILRADIAALRVAQAEQLTDAGAAAEESS